jgi:putative hydrolase of the HAD superfamily
VPEVLIIDVDGVLRRWDPAIIAEAERGNGLPSGVLAEAAFADRDVLQAATTGVLTDRQWRAGVADQLSARYGENGQRAVAAWSSSAGEVNAEVLDLVRAYRRDHPVAVLSNGTDRLPADLVRLGLDLEVDAIFNSWQLGATKPAPEVFRQVCTQLGVEAADCLFVDDTAGHAQAAAELGMISHHYTEPSRLARFLAAQPG